LSDVRSPDLSAVWRAAITRDRSDHRARARHSQLRAQPPRLPPHARWLLGWQADKGRPDLIKTLVRGYAAELW